MKSSAAAGGGVGKDARAPADAKAMDSAMRLDTSSLIPASLLHWTTCLQRERVSFLHLKAGWEQAPC
jgi:hypothetical protein